MKKVSTSDVKQVRFRVHGLVEVTIDGNVARYEAWGPFNEEMGIAYNAIQEQVLPEMAALKRWGHLSVFHVSMMASPDTLAKFTDALKACKSQGLAPYATAFVAGSEVEGAELMGELLAKCYADAGLLLMVFPEATEAEAWLQSTLSYADPTEDTDAAR
jgi:hypothetical protein